MSLLEKIKESVDQDAQVRSVLVGSHWVVVCSRNCGMASALHGSHRHGVPEVRDAGHKENALQYKSEQLEVVQISPDEGSGYED